MKLSVAMCTYNGSKYVEEQLNSIINQTRAIDEIVIVDDASQDNTVEIVDRLLLASGIAYKLIINEKNMNFNASFQKCIRQCTGDIIFTADQDDVWDEHKVEIMTARFVENPRCVLCFSDGQVVDSNLEIINPSVWDSMNYYRAGFRGAKTTQEEYRCILMYRWLVSGTMMAVRRDFMEKSMPLPDSCKDDWIHDSWLSVMAPIYGDVAIVDEKLVKYRQHGNNVCGASTVVRDDKAQLINSIQKILFYFDRDVVRLQVFLDANRDIMDAEYIQLVQSYIDLFTPMMDYNTLGKLGKLVFIIKRIMDGRLRVCNITRGELIRYLIYTTVARK